MIERGEIYRRVWGYEMAHGDRSVDVFIRKLRIKLEQLSPSWSYIHTHFGIGYRFDPEPLDPSASDAPCRAAATRRASRARSADAEPARSSRASTA